MNGSGDFMRNNDGFDLIRTFDGDPPRLLLNRFCFERARDFFSGPRDLREILLNFSEYFLRVEIAD